MKTETTRSTRLNMRIAPTALDEIKAAAMANQQDVSAFVLGAAMDKARSVMIEQTLITLTPLQMAQLEEALNAPAKASPALVKLFTDAAKPKVVKSRT